MSPSETTTTTRDVATVRHELRWAERELRALAGRRDELEAELLNLLLCGPPSPYPHQARRHAG